jgi:hypothetical protein
MTLTATNPARWQAAGLGECSLRQSENNPECGPMDRGTQETIAARKREFAIGIDIGAAGALALLTPSGDLLEVADMPTLRDGPKNRATVNSRLLAEIVDRWRATEASSNMYRRGLAKVPRGLSPSAALVASSKVFWPRAAFPQGL